MKTPKYILSTTPHAEQRYETVGDWISGDPSEIVVSDMKNPDYEFCVMVHELIEFYLCQKKGITDKEVTAFDEMFEKERKAGLHSDDEEPGDDPRAPYKSEHEFSGIIERMISHKLGFDWKTYDKTIMSL